MFNKNWKETAHAFGVKCLKKQQTRLRLNTCNLELKRVLYEQKQYERQGEGERTAGKTNQAFLKALTGSGTEE